MLCSNSEVAVSRPGHLNCAGTPDSQSRIHMEICSRKAKYTTEGDAGDAEIQP